MAYEPLTLAALKAARSRSTPNEQELTQYDAKIASDALQGVQCTLSLPSYLPKGDMRAYASAVGAHYQKQGFVVEVMGGAVKVSGW